MKKISYLFIALFFVFTSCVSEPGVSEAMSEYRFKDGVTSITVPGWVIELASGFSDLEESEKELLESIDKVAVIAIENDDLNLRTNFHEEFYEKINKNKEYEELVVVRDDGESVTVFGKMNDTTITDLIVLVGGDENVMVYLKGEFSPELLKDKIDLTDTDKFLSFSF